MSGFISTVNPPVDLAAPSPAPQIVEADGWFPAIDLAAMRDQARFDTTITDARLREAVRAAMHTVMNDLLDWQGDRMFEGHGRLENVPARMIDGESALVGAWRRAIYSYARAEVVEGYADYDATGAGEDKADEMALAPAQLRRNGLHAVRDLLGKPRILVTSI